MKTFFGVVRFICFCFGVLIIVGLWKSCGVGVAQHELQCNNGFTSDVYTRIAVDGNEVELYSNAKLLPDTYTIPEDTICLLIER